MIPTKIKIKTDGTELEFTETITKDTKGKKLTEPIHQYIYTKSKTKKGMALPLTDVQLKSLLDNQNLNI